MTTPYLYMPFSLWSALTDEQRQHYLTKHRLEFAGYTFYGSAGMPTDIEFRPFKELAVDHLMMVYSRWLKDNSKTIPTPYRVEGHKLCETCGQSYSVHPMSGLKDNNGDFYLHRLCNDELVKL